MVVAFHGSLGAWPRGAWPRGALDGAVGTLAPPCLCFPTTKSGGVSWPGAEICAPEEELQGISISYSKGLTDWSVGQHQPIWCKK